MTTVDKIWRVIWPLAVFLGINISVQSVFSWYSVGRNVLNSGGQVSTSAQIMNDFTVQIMFYTMIITIPVMVMLMKKDEDSKRFFSFAKHYNRISFKAFILLLPLGICMCLGIAKLVTIFPIDNIIGSYEEVVNSYNQSSIAFRALVLCILVPVAEELVYRGMFYKRLKEYFETTIAAYIAAIVFGVVHMNLVQGLYAFLCALILIYVYEKYKTILAPIFLHIIVNTMALISGEFQVFDKINNTFIAKLFFMVLELAGIVALLRVIWVKKSSNGKVISS